MHRRRHYPSRAMDNRTPRVLLTLLTLLFAAACGGDSPTDPGPETPPGPPEATAPTASSTTLGPMQEIVLSGLPAGRIDLQADIAPEGGGASDQPGPYQMPLFPTAGGTYRLVIPLHPTTLTGGGRVDVRVRGEGLVTAPIRLTLAPLPAAPGAFSAALDSLQLLVDLSLAREGLTRADLLAENAVDLLPKRLLPLSIVQSLLDDPSHDRDLRDLTRGSPSFAPLVGSAPIDTDLIDRLVAAAGLPSFWNAMLDTARAALDTPSPGMQAGATDGLATAAMDITDAWSLDAAMNIAAEAKRSIDPDNPQAKVREDIGLALGAAGLVAGPLAGTVIAGVSITQYLYNLTQEMLAKTLPSVLTGLSFSVDPARFEEDHPGPGEYYNVRVSAQSEGMVLDKAILNAVLQAVGGVRTGASFFSSASGVVDQINNVGSFITEQVVSRVPDSDGMLRIDPETWSNILLLDSGWTTARVAGDAITVGNQHTYQPVRVGVAILTVETHVSHFGDAAPVSAQETIEVAPIRVEVTASKTTVTPGEIVTLDIVVQDALDVDLDWTLSAGTWVSGPEWLGGNAWRAELLTPAQTSEYPVRVKFTSTATGGARSAPGAPERAGVVGIYTGFLLVEPQTATLLPGESQTFTATVGGEDHEVTWSAIGPDGGPAPISSTGVFTAPTLLGEYQVIATSVDTPDLTGTAEVNVTGMCSWSLTIGGSYGGTWSGESAGHFYPDEPSGGGNFTMTYQQNEYTDYPIGTIWAAGPGSSVATGSWPTNFSFSTSEDAIWVGVAPPDETFPPLHVSANDGTTVVGSVTGTAMLALGAGEVELAPFTFRFRSAHNFDCGAN